MPIKAVGVWDTVGMPLHLILTSTSSSLFLLTGSLGIPNAGIWPGKPGEYSFVDTKVSDNIEYAFHALALDEQRRPFSPTIWEKPAGQKLPKLLKQCWFPGVHSNVGGSYEDAQIADITLAWMISQLDNLIQFDEEYITWQHELNLKYYKKKPEEARKWGLGMIYDSKKGLQALAGSTTRTPGRYSATDTQTGKPTGRRLENTNEHVHACVRVRMGLGGLGTADSGPYKSQALQGWRLAGCEKNGEDANNTADSQHTGGRNIRWEYGGDAKQGPEITLPEDTLGDVELKLLEMYPDVSQKIWGICPKTQR